MRTDYSAAVAAGIVSLALVAMATGGCGGARPEGRAVAPSAAVIHHALTVHLDVAEHIVEVVDVLDLGAHAQAPATFVLHRGLVPTVRSEGWTLEALDADTTAAFFGLNATTESVRERVPLDGWRLTPHDGPSQVTLSYAGVVHHPLAQSGEEYQRSFSETPGTIDTQGVFLSGTSFWVPSFGAELMTFELTIEAMPEGWQAVSQGRREALAGGVRWVNDQPTEEVYLVGGPLELTEARAGEVEVLAYLRDADAALAHRYIDATQRYLRLYEGMLGPFPYPSFALVENFWETGYGMPGFTLLGPKIIRFPWILTSSYPHELLHNWWGNSVFVDYTRGNWCEGLTAYMADHLFAEQRGEGVRHRRDLLQKYADHVRAEDDLPLSAFRGRRSAASEAVGYGKTAMFFHMLRRAVGDEAFLQSLRLFWKTFAFTRAGFADLAWAFSETTGTDWGPFFAAWTTRPGAPELAVERAQVGATPNGAWQLELTLRQAQQADPWPLTVPVAVTMADTAEPLWVELAFDGRLASATIACPALPLRLDVDPAFDVMRRLDTLEVAPALSTLLGAEAPLYVLPSTGNGEELAAWTALAEQWAAPAAPRLVTDEELDHLPAESVFVLGWDNRLAGNVAARLATQGVELRADGVVLSEQLVGRDGHSVVLVARGEEDPTAAVAWIAASPVAAIPGLARKLPHYTRYGMLVFTGNEPQNIAKGAWEPAGAPTVVQLGGTSLVPLTLPERAPLAAPPPRFEAAPLGAHAIALADPAFAGRGLGSEGLSQATAWVETRFAELGLQPLDGQGFRQQIEWTGGDPQRTVPVVNLVGALPGSVPELAHAPVVLMAHLDHLGTGWPEAREGMQGQVHPGADDNASGVAVLLAVAAALATEPARPRPIVFAVVSGEEAGLIGSRHLMEGLVRSGQPSSCVNLDSVGRLADGKLYVLNGDSATEWPHIFMGVGYSSGHETTLVTEPLDSSDQVACIERGIPAVQLFTGPHADYHRPSDTADKLDVDGMVVVAEVVQMTLGYLAERVEPLTANGQSPAPSAQPGARKASLGTMPDFAYAGPGVRIQSVGEGSPAARAGLLPGDVIVGLSDGSDEREVAGLRGFSDALKHHAPGDEVTVRFLRGADEMRVQVVLGTR